MAKRLVIVLMAGMLMLNLVACGNTGAAENPSVQNSAEENSVEEDVAISETISEEDSVATEEVSEENSEVLEEVDYSITAVEAKINEIVATYPNEDSRQIAAVVIGTNAKYMAEDEIEEVLNAYEFSKEEVNQLFMDYFAMKAEVVSTLNQIAEGATFDEVPDYFVLSPIYAYCLNPTEYEECYNLEEEYKRCFENHISTGNSEYTCEVGHDEGNPSIARMLIMSMGISLGFSEFEEYDECIPFADEYAKTLEQ